MDSFKYFLTGIFYSSPSNNNSCCQGQRARLVVSFASRPALLDLFAWFSAALKPTAHFDNVRWRRATRFSETPFCVIRKAAPSLYLREKLVPPFGGVRFA
jgi:hypothetical protein